jgi:uncharacterized membrane protein
VREAKVRYAGLLIGFGLGALLDGILFERILHWRAPAASAAWFPIIAWLMTLAGVLILWSALRGPGPLPSSRVFAGHLVMSWGAFNMLEGAIEHSVVLLAAGVVLAVLGYILHRTGLRPSVAERRSGYDRRSPAAESLSARC